METALTMEWLGWGKWYNCKGKCKWNVSPFYKLGMYKMSPELTIQIRKLYKIIGINYY